METKRKMDRRKFLKMSAACAAAASSAAIIMSSYNRELENKKNNERTIIGCHEAKASR